MFFRIIGGAIFLSLLFLLSSCDKTVQVNFDFQTIPHSYEMQGEVIVDSMMSPMSLDLYHGLLLTIDRKGKHRLKVFDPQTGRELQSTLRTGRGTHEMLQPWIISIQHDTCWVFDSMSKKIIALHGQYQDSLSICRELFIKENTGNMVVSMGDGGFLGTGHADSIQFFASYTHGGQLKDAFGAYPEFIPYENSNTIEDVVFYNTIYSGRLGLSLEEEKIAYAYIKFNSIDIYDLKGQLLHRISGPENIDVKVNRASPREGTVLFDSQPKYLAYRQVKVGPKEIWASHSGVVLTRENYTEIIPRKIYCFSWKGKILRELRFDIPINNYAIDWENERLYCLSEKDFQPCIYEFSLKDIL